jgi:hypothetical protein
VPVWAALGAQLASFILDGTSHLVNVSLHTTREAYFTDRAAACGVFIARATSQTLRQGTHRSGSDTGDVSYTHDLYGAIDGPVFAFRTASFANKARLLLLLRRSLKIAHHVGRLCDMREGFMVAGGVVSAPGDHRSQGIQYKTLNPNLTLGVG